MYRFEDIITADEDMAANVEKAKAIKDAQFPVMIYGETGTGKELFAQAIHNESINREKPFVAQNCSSLPESVFESMLWGVAKGAYTGAIERPGLFEEAEGGTLFLDEINSLPLHLQIKFLRVIENFKVLRVGASKTRTVKVRIITAMNDTPQNVIENNIIRKDLFFRLSVASIGLSPLRERQQDIKLYVDFFIRENNQTYGKKIKGISQELERFFHVYPWPGNVRELRHILEIACCLAKEDVIQSCDLPDYIFSTKYSACEISPDHHADEQGKEDSSNERRNLLFDNNESLESRVACFEKSIIEKALHKFDGNLSKAARALSVPRQTLKYKVERYGIFVSREESN